MNGAHLDENVEAPPEGVDSLCLDSQFIQCADGISGTPALLLRDLEEHIVILLFKLRCFVHVC